MTDSPVIHADIGDGKQRRFFLGADELQQIRRECGRAWFTLYKEFSKNADQFEVQAVLRLALIGGGETPKEAAEIASYYCTPPRPLMPVYLLAHDVLNALWLGWTPRKQGAGVTASDMDNYFTDLEAQLIKKGHDPAIIKGKSFAEIQLLLEALRDDEAAAPDVEVFAALKAGMKK